MNQRTLANILKVGTYLSFLCIFFVFKNLLFPYITSKQIYFNVLIEIMVFFWAWLVIKYPEWRPKKNLINFGLLAFFGAVLLSSVFGVDFNLSFWGDVERMLGWFHLIHFFFFYLIILTVFRTWEDWKTLYIVSIVVATFVSFYGILQHYEVVKSPWGSARIITTIGNAAYVGAYSIFNIFFCLILINREKLNIVKMLYIVPMIFIFFALVFSGTRGAYVGMLASMAVIAFIMVVFNKNVKVKYFSLAGIAVLALLVGLIFIGKNTDFVKSNPYIYRIAALSFKDNTFQTRFVSWKAAWQDFGAHPVIGSGYGNYAITFDKYFDPKFFNFTRSETYFDRAHNNLVDIASTTGALGLATYLLIFIFTAYYLIKGMRTGKIAIGEFALLTGLIIAYFIQNLLVFDALVTYMSLMVVLGYVYWLSEKNEEPLYAREEPFSTGQFYLAGVVGLALCLVIYHGNYKPYVMLVKTIGAQNDYAQKRDIKSAVDIYRDALKTNSVLDRDSRTTLIRLVTGGMQGLQQMDKKEAGAIMDFTIDHAQRNVKYNPKDSLNQMMLAQVYYAAAGVYQGDGIKSFEYSNKALEAIDRSIEASPGRMPIYFYKAQILLSRGDKDKAFETLKYSAGLNADYPDSSASLRASTILIRKPRKNWKILISASISEAQRDALPA